jgi:hypothetical protein
MAIAMRNISSEIWSARNGLDAGDVGLGLGVGANITFFPLQKLVHYALDK